MESRARTKRNQNKSSNVCAQLWSGKGKLTFSVLVPCVDIKEGKRKRARVEREEERVISVPAGARELTEQTGPVKPSHRLAHRYPSFSITSLVSTRKKLTMRSVLVSICTIKR